MTVYSNTARFDTGRPLSEDELRNLAPSIFAVAPHSSRSDRFKPIPTIEILRNLASQGFHAVGAKQSTARSADRREFTKHLVRLRRFDVDQSKYLVGDNVLECLLKNANDGTSVYDLLAGMFRIACMNSMVAQTSTIDSIKVRHSGDVQSKVIEGTFRVLESAESVLSAPQDWGRIELNSESRQAYAEAAHVLRFGDAEGNVETPIQPRQLLLPRRVEDRKSDLWTTFNVVQENALKGGLTAVGRDSHNRPRRSTTRAVNGIDQDVKLNKALWTLSEKMAGILKSAA